MEVKRRYLNSAATSALGADASLSVTGYGAMKYSRKGDEWTFGGRKVVAAPQIVTVPGIEGSESLTVQLK